ncbi:MAG: VanZ family protein [Magnetococcales bacterium]|nr:VanZ family protein [Magnetococcales bacterium]
MQLEPNGQSGIPAFTRKKGLLVGLLLGYSFVMFGLSSMTGQELPEPFFENQDKLEHMFAYGVMAVVAWSVLRQWTVLRHCWLWAWVYAVVYGVTDEWHQLFVPGRYGDLFDLLADAVGAALAIAMLEFLRTRRGSRLLLVCPRSVRASSVP